MNAAMDKSNVPTWTREMVFRDAAAAVMQHAPEIYDLLERGLTDDPPVYYDLSLYTKTFCARYDKEFHHWVDTLQEHLGVHFPGDWAHETKCYGLHPDLILRGSQHYEQEACSWEDRRPPGFAASEELQNAWRLLGWIKCCDTMKKLAANGEIDV